MSIIPEFSNFAVSKTEYPIVRSGTELFDIDKPIYWLLEFNSFCLEKYLQDAWRATVNRLQAVNQDGYNYSTTLSFASRVGYDPIPFLQEANYNFPLLALYRSGDGSIMEKNRMAKIRFTQPLEMLVILPPVGPDQAELLTPYLKAARDVVAVKNESGIDDDFFGGVWIGPSAGYEKIGCTSFNFENIPTKTNLYMPTLIMGLTMYETSGPSNASPILHISGLDGYITLDGYVQHKDFIIINTDHEKPPTNNL